MFYLCPFFSCNCNDPSNSLATPLAKIASKLSWDSQVGNHGERARLAKPPIPRENALKSCTPVELPALCAWRSRGPRYPACLRTKTLIVACYLLVYSKSSASSTTWHRAGSAAVKDCVAASVAHDPSRE
jgi:hypothetical protein